MTSEAGWCTSRRRRRYRCSAVSGAPLLAFRELDEHPEDETFRGIAVLRLDGGLFFATADALHERLRGVMERAEPELHAVVLDLGGVDFVDSQGAAKLAELAETGVRDGVVLRLAHVKTGVLRMLAADGVLEQSAPIACTSGSPT